MPQHTILVVEDDEILGGPICTSLQRHGWGAALATSPEEAIRLVASFHPDVVLTVPELSGLGCVELIRRVHEADPGTAVILMTGDGDGDVQHAVEAMKAGACDFLSRPVVPVELQLRIERALAARRIEKTLGFYRSRDARDAGMAALLGDSPPMQAMKDTLRQLLDAETRMSANDLPAVLITGETGTGKARVARALHFDGACSGGTFVEVDCASIPSHLLEAELFGHEKGAFTDARERHPGLVEAADGGTLFLDGIGELDLALQAKLLRLLEERSIRRLGSVQEIKVSLRIIGATSRNLEQMVREGRFRSDLYSRLRAISIRVPPLRGRGEDIVTLARHFLDLLGRRNGKPGMQFDTKALAVLKGYAWPGNVRELRNMLEQTVLLAEGKLVTPNQLAICPGLSGPCDRDFHTLDSYCMSVPSAGVSVPDVERDLVIKMLDKTDWNVTKSARLLGLTRDMLRYRIEKLGLERPQR